MLSPRETTETPIVPNERTQEEIKDILDKEEKEKEEAGKPEELPK